MKLFYEGDRLMVVGLSNEGLPEPSAYKEIGEGAALHLVDTGEEYIFHNGMWELDLRKALAPELIYNGV